jgi:uncharacterized protein
VDAGPLFAYLDADDAYHSASVAFLQHHPGPLAVPVLVVAEVAYLAGTRLGSDVETRFLGDLANGNFVAVQVDNSDWLRIADLVHRYRDLPLGTVDASVVAAAERLNVRAVATLDRRHYSVVRPRHVAAFELLP